MEKLREAYFPDSSDKKAIRDQNLALMSDLVFCDSILKAVVLQTNANRKITHQNQHKNTFLFRFQFDAVFV